MHSFSITSIFVALAALTAAVPHPMRHTGLHVRGSNFGMIAGRSAVDGACGGASGDSCQPGYCCSQWGYCGVTEEYCGAGCNSAFGTCGAGSEPTTPASSSAPASHTTAAPTSSAAGIVTKFHPAPTPTSTTAAPVATTTSGSGSGSHAGSDSYKTYTGNGSPSSGWPSEDAWVDFESMWSANLRIISISCTQFGQDNNSDQENDELKSAIQSVASSSGIDERFILAVVMQESKGCVRAPTTNYGVRNPGLMQDHDGTGTCNDASVSNPCPQSEILQMIKDGTTGTAAGDGLQQCMAQSGASDVSKYYKAARIYNSGSVTDDNLGLGVATHCYASDIANRLTGWVDATSSCSL